MNIKYKDKRGEGTIDFPCKINECSIESKAFSKLAELLVRGPSIISAASNVVF